MQTDGNEAGPPVPGWEVELQHVHDLLGQVCALIETCSRPPIDLAPAVAEVQSGFEELYVVWRWREDPLEPSQRLRAHLTNAAGALQPGVAEAAALGFAVEALQKALGHAERAEEYFARALFQAPPPIPDLRASEDVPRLHQLERRVLVPSLKAAPAPQPEVQITPPQRPPPETEEELLAQAEAMTQSAFAALEQQKAARAAPPPEDEDEEEAAAVPEGFLLDPLPVLSETQFVEARAHELFEDVVMLANQRTPLLEDPWRSSLALERRLLAVIDALVALGGRGLQHLDTLTRGVPLKDPDRLLGLTLVAGCVEGRDALAMAERLFLEQVIVDPAYATAFGQGLVLVPHPHVEPLARRFLEHPMELCRSVGLRVLMHRGAATPADIERAVEDGVRVLQVALPSYARRRDPEARDATTRGLDALEQEPDDAELADAVWRSLVLSHHPLALSTLRRGMEGPLAGLAAAHFAVAGGQEEAQELLERAREQPTAALLGALGWAGPMEAVATLIAALETADDDGKVAAAYALERLTAADLKEEAEIAPELQLDPEIPEPDTGDEEEATLAQELSDPRDLPDEGSPDLLERPSTDPERWREWWKENQPRFDAGKRYRRGLPYCAPVVLQELDTGPCFPAERRLLQHELVYRTSSHVHFDPHDFVRVQEESLRQWEPAAARRVGIPGTWSVTYARD